MCDKDNIDHECLRPPGVLQDMVHGLDVSLGQVHHVHVVAVPRPVPRLVVTPVHRDLLPPPDGHLTRATTTLVMFQMSGRGHLRDVRHQVVGDAERVLADVPGLVRARGVEVAEEGDCPGGVRRGHVHHHLLHGVLGGAVRVGALPDPEQRT